MHLYMELHWDHYSIDDWQLDSIDDLIALTNKARVNHALMTLLVLATARPVYIP